MLKANVFESLMANGKASGETKNFISETLARRARQEKRSQDIQMGIDARRTMRISLAKWETRRNDILRHILDEFNGDKEVLESWQGELFQVNENIRRLKETLGIK